MAVNKVELADGTSLIDITDSTVEASDVAAGKVFYTAAGVRTVGTAQGSSPLDAYPIGSIYQSMNPTSPAELFGGYWNRVKGQFVLSAADSEDIGTEPDDSLCYREAGATGGSERVTLTVEQLPAHSHGIGENNNRSFITTDHSNTPSRTTVSSGSGAANMLRSAVGLQRFSATSNSGSGQSHGNMPPYIAAYTWERVEPPEELGA